MPAGLVSKSENNAIVGRFRTPEEVKVPASMAVPSETVVVGKVASTCQTLPSTELDAVSTPPLRATRSQMGGTPVSVRLASVAV